MKKIFISVSILVLFITINVFTSTISDELLGIKLGTKYKILSKNYKLLPIKDKNEFGKIFKIVYAENFGIETLLYFFKSKVYKIKLVYGKDFADETDWENIFNQSKFNYGAYLSEVISSDITNYIETYTWQDENIKQVLEKVSNNSVLEKFSVSIVDKKVENEILNQTPVQKFLNKIFSIF